MRCANCKEWLRVDGKPFPPADPQLAQLHECLRLLGGPFDYPFDGGPEGDYPDLFVSDDEARYRDGRYADWLEREF